MLNWFGRHKPDVSPVHRSASEVIAGLTDPDGVENLVAVTAALDALTQRSGLFTEDRFDEIQRLDSAAQPLLFGMIKEYLATARHKKARESKLWGSATSYLQELYRAYLLCLKRYEADPRGSTRFRLKLPIAVARALRALRLQLKWALLRYATPEQHLWTEMAGLYAFAVSNGIADEEVPFYLGRQTSVKEEFVTALMIAACSSDSLRPAELDLATRLVDLYSRHFVISEQPFEGCTHWFDLQASHTPVHASTPPPENDSVRYVGAGDALAELEAVRVEITRTETVPLALLFYEKQNDLLLLAALNHLALDWAGISHARMDERRTASARITVVPGLPGILRALDFAVNDSLDFTDQAAAESWVVENISAGGYGAVIPAIAGDWVEVGSLVGIEGNSIRDWRVGVVRRVNRLEGDQQRVGMQLLGTTAVRVLLSQNAARSVPAVLIVETQDGVEVLVRSGMFTHMNETEMLLRNKRLRLKPAKVVERSAHAERVALQVVPHTV